MSGQPLPCEREELGSLFLFEKLTDEQLARLCREGRVEKFEPGYVYREGEPATCFFVLLEARWSSHAGSGTTTWRSTAPPTGVRTQVPCRRM